MVHLDSDIATLLSDNKKFRISGKKFLITGGAGFLGSWLCDILIAKNADVYCIDNLSSGRAENIKHLLSNKSFVFKKHDFRFFIETARSAAIFFRAFWVFF